MASLDRSPTKSPTKHEFNFNTSFKPTSSSSLKKNNNGDGNTKKKNSGGTTTSALTQKRSTRNSSAPEFMVSPLPTASPDRSPMKFEFNFDTGFKPTTSSSSLKKKNDGDDNMKMKKTNSGETKTSKLTNPTGSPPSLTKSLSSLSDLKDLTTSRLDSLKRLVDCSYSGIVKDSEASYYRLHKRLKTQTQTCQEMMDEAEKGYNKMMEQIDESRDAMNTSYMELIEDAQANASRVCKTSIPELLKICEKSIDGLRSRYGVASTSH